MTLERTQSYKQEHKGEDVTVYQSKPRRNIRGQCT